MTHAEQLEIPLGQARAAVASSPESVAGTVRITSTDTLMHGLIAPALRSLSARHPLSIEPGRATWIAPDDALPEHPCVIWRKRQFPKAVVRYRVGSILTVMERVAMGLGIGVLPVFLTEHRPELTRLTDVIEECRTELWLLTHPESRHLQRISTVFRHLSETLSLRHRSPPVHWPAGKSRSIRRPVAVIFVTVAEGCLQPFGVRMAFSIRASTCPPSTRMWTASTRSPPLTTMGSSLAARMRRRDEAMSVLRSSTGASQGARAQRKMAQSLLPSGSRT